MSIFTKCQGQKKDWGLLRLIFALIFLGSMFMYMFKICVFHIWINFFLNEQIKFFFFLDAAVEFFNVNKKIFYYYFSCHLSFKSANNTYHLSHINFLLVSWRWKPNWLQVKNNRNQIDCYKNVGTKLTAIPKYKDQNDILAKI